MFKDAADFKKVYIACGYTDLRCGIDGLADEIQNHYQLDPFDEGSLFLFCGRNRSNQRTSMGRRWIPSAVQKT